VHEEFVSTGQTVNSGFYCDILRRKTKRLSSPTHHTPLIWHPVNSSYFQKWNCSWKDAGLIPLRRYRLNRRECLTLIEKDFHEVFQKWRRRWDWCLHVGGNYFEGDCGQWALWWVLQFLQHQSGKFWILPRMYWLDIARLFKKLLRVFYNWLHVSVVTPLSSPNQDYVTLIMIWNIKFENGYTSPWLQFKMFIITHVFNHVRMSIQLNIKKNGLKWSKSLDKNFKPKYATQ